MLKQELLSQVAQATGHPERLVREILESTKDVVLRTLSGGGSVMLLGLGKLTVVHRGPRQARNLHTRESVVVPPRNAAVLRVSNAVRDAINSGQGLDNWLKRCPDV